MKVISIPQHNCYQLLWPNIALKKALIHEKDTKEIIALKESAHVFSQNLCLDFLGAYTTSVLKILLQKNPADKMGIKWIVFGAIKYTRN